MGQEKFLKWCCIGYDFRPNRYQLLEAFLNAKGVPNQLDLIDIPPSDFNESFEKVTQTYDQIRVESPHGLGVFSFFKKQEALMSRLKAVDCVFKDDHRQWWCRSLTYHSLCESLQGVGEMLDLEKSVLIVGAGASARAALAACAKMGFKNFNITNKFDEQGLELIREMNANFFGLNLEFVPQHRLTLLPGTNCLLINTTPPDASNDLLPELYYFNFLKKNGVVVDLTVDPLYTQLVKEALEIKNYVIFGSELAAVSDSYWIKWVTGREFDHDEIKNYYRQELLNQAALQSEGTKDQE
jgi:shikimate 5-dehydrogenase